MQAVALTIAGSDPSGGAGLQADLKTFHRFGVYGEAVVTLLTVQNSQRLDRVECVSPEMVIAQLRAVLEDIPPHAAKLGALGSAETIRAIAREARGFRFPLVIDPVMISKHGTLLIHEDAVEALRGELLASAFLLTPNLQEAEALTGLQVRDLPAMRQAAERLRDLGAKHVLVKGGHLPGSPIDLLLASGMAYEIPGERVETRHTHGTGCTYSAAITAELAKGTELVDAVHLAKAFITRAIRTNPGLGRGAGPLNHQA
ncbi:MAG TPA: bifunctional hydroxymethylpyrimidine kinase/phosphomethylpyrimidine kinase [Bryobacteraceae bacterium]|nr:bifunctional hydroxymethylpyrimidine kinase/phosphomethylpyrimidine kinase [Bryobacteraceae bacterium]